MCKPDHYGIEYEINPWMDRQVGTDPATAARQWTALRDTLVGLSVEIALVEPVKGLPDLIFTANAGLVFRSIFIPSRFRHGVRQGEEPYYTDWARENGWEIVPIPGDHHFEGAGDALFVGERSSPAIGSGPTRGATSGSASDSGSRSCPSNSWTLATITSIPASARSPRDAAIYYPGRIR